MEGAYRLRLKKVKVRGLWDSCPKSGFLDLNERPRIASGRDSDGVRAWI
jgi:hypothetical protein